MKYILASIFILFTSIVMAQTPFEGTIVYHINKSRSGSDRDPELTALFGKNAIRLRFKENDVVDKVELLIRLDSGLIYYLNAEDKSYTTKPLPAAKEAIEMTTKTFAGYATQPLEISSDKLDGIAGMLFGGGTTVLHISNELYFPVPEKYRNTMELVVVNKNRIVLGADFNLELYKTAVAGPTDTVNGEPLSAAAIRVTQEKLPEAIFSVPKEYIKQ